MKTISAALQAHLDGDLTTLAQIVKITRADGVVKAFTNHDADLTVDGVLYKADGAFSAGVYSGKAGLKANDYDVEGVLDSAELSEAEIRRGNYDHARIDVALVNWKDVAQGAIALRRGWIGEVVLKGGRYVASLRGLHDLLQRPIGSFYTPECRHDLGSAKCGVDLSSLKVAGQVTSVVDASCFCDASRSEVDAYFAYGKLLWTSGKNAGLSMEVLAWDASSKKITLWLPMPDLPCIGDAYDLYPGCNKQYSTCLEKFSNGLNFGGFPHLPGLAKVLQYPESS